VDLMRICNTLLFIAMAMQFPTSFVMAAMPQGDGTKPLAGVRSAMGAIFAEDHVAQEALQIHDRALQLDDAACFALLSKWVLPSHSHNSLRMQCEFTPTCPAPMLERSDGAAGESSGPDQRQFTGGDLVSPVMDLVKVATRLNRLDEIQTVVDQWNMPLRKSGCVRFWHWPDRLQDLPGNDIPKPWQFGRAVISLPHVSWLANWPYFCSRMHCRARFLAVSDGSGRSSRADSYWMPQLPPGSKSMK
jgi:hypothetical protein